MESQRDLVLWLQQQGLLNTLTSCHLCGAEVTLNKRRACTDECSYRCKGKSRHEITVRLTSFFQRFRVALPDILNFMRDYLLGLSLKQCAAHINICYNSTAVRRGTLIREVMQETVYLEYFHEDASFKMDGICEIDESLFGRKTKYHYGRQVGVRTWVFGITARESGHLLLFPVDDR